MLILSAIAMLISVAALGALAYLASPGARPDAEAEPVWPDDGSTPEGFFGS